MDEAMSVFVSLNPVIREKDGVTTRRYEFHHALISGIILILRPLDPVTNDPIKAKANENNPTLFPGS